MAYYGSNQQLERQTSLRPIVEPGAPRWAALGPGSGTARTAALYTVATAGAAAWVGVLTALVFTATSAPMPSLVAMVALIAGPLWGAFELHRRAMPYVVSAGTGWSLDGQRIDGEVFAYLEDIDGRFAFAEKLIKEIPTGIDWVDVADDVAALRWEAAEHAAKVSAIDEELRDFRYAAAGTPQAALKKALERRRAEHKDVLIDLRWEADSLARVAGNALAAAKVALAATGDVTRLDAVTPSREALVASANLAGAKARMQLLTEVWAELDPTGTLLHEQHPELEPPKRTTEG